MDIQSFFGSNTSSSVSDTSPCKDNSSNSSDSYSEHAEPPSKKVCRKKFWPLASKRKYSETWQKEFSWLVYDEDIDGVLCQVCKQTTVDSSRQHTGGVGLQNLFEIGRKLLRK